MASSLGRILSRFNFAIFYTLGWKNVKANSPIRQLNNSLADSQNDTITHITNDFSTWKTGNPLHRPR